VDAAPRVIDAAPPVALPLRSPNFAFLATHDERLVVLGTQAERLFADDPHAALTKLRLFAELLAQRAAANAGLYSSYQEGQAELLARLVARGILTRDVADLFHRLRKAGNAATHEFQGDAREALHQLRMARELGVWFHRAFGAAKGWAPGAFVPPPDPKKETEELAGELARLRALVSAQQAATKAAEDALEEEARKRLSAEERAAKEAEERAIYAELAEMSGAAQAKLAAELSTLQAKAAAAPLPVREAITVKAAAASSKVVLDEAATRRRIDEQLREAGWEADSDLLRFQKGARPQLGKNLAIAEWPTASGPMDYALFLGLELVAVVEAKRASKDVSSDIDQSKRYSRDLTLHGDAKVAGGPWGKYRVPFLFATNGRAYLKQIETKSGIWFLDARRKENHARPLEGWPTPEGLRAQLGQDIDKAHAALAAEPTDYLGLRPYQIAAIRAAETAIEQGKRALLVAMATGTGKTKTCIGLVYRLIKTKRFRRVLFLVDRSALAEQTENAFKDARLENLQTFTDIFELRGIADTTVESDTKVHVATVQSMVKRVVLTEGVPPPVDAYDCVIIDECHRGYLLDRELGDEEIAFRDEDDYISKYRRVLEHFDAVKIGLTATPALHTAEIFGQPVYHYRYRDAVIDGFLVDYAPPLRIVTKLAADGITWSAGEEMTVFDPSTQQLDLFTTPDEVKLEIDSFNKRVITESFNRVVCGRLAAHIDPSAGEKTIVFAATDDHADLVVRLLKEAFDAQYGGVDDDAVVKITGRADKPRQLIRRFRNERLPSVAVTVDLLTTGIDVPKVSNLVFLRRVKSRILYDQMIGRGTRLCPEIGKECFRVFDAVDMFTDIQDFTDMKPVVVNPNLTFAKLVKSLGAAPEEAQQGLLDQILAKLQRRAKRMSAAETEAFASTAGMAPAALIQRFRQGQPSEAAAWFGERPAVAMHLDQNVPVKLYPVLVSHHADELREETHGFGEGNQRPEDFLDGFSAFIRQNMNQVPALLVVTQRPKELTRAELRELRFLLDEKGYSEVSLRTAWKDRTNADIAASIIGHIRRAALGSALVPYAERVDRALKKLLAAKKWTDPQRKWLTRIGKQLTVETIVDREALDEGEFKNQGGGFERLNKQFDGKLDEILGELREDIWKDAG
jgi:type I restriction enzyme R subunit